MTNLQTHEDGYLLSFQAFLEHLTPNDKDLIAYMVQEQITHSPLTVLDVGTGNGLLAAKLHDHLVNKGIHVTEWVGIDPHEHLAEATQRMQHRAFTPIRTTFEDYLPGRKFDIVLASHVFYHIPHYYHEISTLKKLADHTKKLGAIIIQSEDDDWNTIKTAAFQHMGKPTTIIGSTSIKQELNTHNINHTTSTYHQHFDATHMIAQDHKGTLHYEFLLQTPYHNIPRKVIQKIKKQLKPQLTLESTIYWIHP